MKKGGETRGGQRKNSMKEGRRGKGVREEWKGEEWGKKQEEAGPEWMNSWIMNVLSRMCQEYLLRSPASEEGTC